MKHLPLLVCTATCGFYSAQAATTDKNDEKPNILWLTFEDTSAYAVSYTHLETVYVPSFSN